MFRSLAEIIDEPGFMENWYRESDLEFEFRETRFSPRRWETIRKIYAHYEPEIIEAALEDPPGGGCDPYFVDWGPIFTPIENAAWESIRYRGTALYPQYPVLGRYFVDFANPYLKIGVELDGQRYHDVAKDRLRDEHLVGSGWKVFRVPGRECFRRYKTDGDLYYEDVTEQERYRAIRHWLTETSDGFFRSLHLHYFTLDGHEFSNFGLVVQSLERHRLVEFPL